MLVYTLANTALQVCRTVALLRFCQVFSHTKALRISYVKKKVEGCLDHLQQWNMKGNKCLSPQMVNRHSSKPFLSGHFLLNLLGKKTFRLTEFNN